MKDIDFDELDKAVNSLMGTASEPKEVVSPEPPPSAEPVAKVEAPAEVITPVTSVEPAAPVVSAPASPAPRPAAVAPAQRRGGRFMDMVHASSDMKGSRAPQPTSREGVTVMPRAQQEVSETPTAPVADAATSTPAPEPKEQAWPDPLDLAATAESDEPKSEVPATSAENISEAVESAPAVASETPLGTPFLSDAKVEKRPLNPGTPSSPPLQLDEAQAETTEEPVVVTDSDEMPRPFVPAELSSDLVAIESGEPKVETAETQEKPAAATTSVPAEEKTPAGPSSIAQQYREQPSSGDQSHAAIYDSSQFPAPLSHPAKKKSGWLWVVWVVLLLALGAGGAVALYMTGVIS